MSFCVSSSSMVSQNRVENDQIIYTVSNPSCSKQDTIIPRLAQSILPGIQRSSSFHEIAQSAQTLVGDKRELSIIRIEKPAQKESEKKRKVECSDGCKDEEVTQEKISSDQDLQSSAAATKGEGITSKQKPKTVISYGEVNLTLDKVLGRGAFGRVFSAACESTSSSNALSNFAVKVNSNQSKMYVETFLNEASLLEELKSKGALEWNIIDLLGVSRQDKKIHLIFPKYISDLRMELVRSAAQLKKTALVADQLFSALWFLSRMDPPIIHGDVKPENIFVESMVPFKIRLGDFGSAKIGSNKNEQTEYIVTRFYRPPEIILGLPFDCSLDMWSAACVVYEYQVKEPLFQSFDEAHLLSKIHRMLGPVSLDFLLSKKEDLKPIRYHEFFTRQELSPPQLKEHLNGKINFPQGDVPEFTSRAHLEDGLFFLKDMLSLMLTWDSSSRLSPDVAKLHPFFISLFDKKDLHYLAKQMYGQDCMRSFEISLKKQAS